MSKSPDAFRTISEVAEWLGIQAHVLRFWESKFSQVKPVKRAGGRRYYRPADMLLLGGIKKLLHDDGLTIKGVQKILREQGVGHVAELSQGLEESAASVQIEADATVVPFQTKTAEKPSTEKEGDGQIGMELTSPEEPADSGSPELPSFLSKPARIKTELPEGSEQEPQQATLNIEASEPAEDKTSGKSPDAIEIASQTPSATEAGEPKPRAINVADVPSDDQIEADTGVLEHLASLDSLTSAQAEQLIPLAEELRAWIERHEAKLAG